MGARTVLAVEPLEDVRECLLADTTAVIRLAVLNRVEDDIRDQHFCPFRREPNHHLRRAITQEFQLPLLDDGLQLQQHGLRCGAQVKPCDVWAETFPCGSASPNSCQVRSSPSTWKLQMRTGRITK